MKVHKPTCDGCDGDVLCLCHFLAVVSERSKQLSGTPTLQIIAIDEKLPRENVGICVYSNVEKVTSN